MSKDGINVPTVPENFPASTDNAPRRVGECRDLRPDEMAGTRGADGRGVLLPTVGYENAGPTPDLRGVEANTGTFDDDGNAYDLPPQRGSFSAMGEQYPGGEDIHPRLVP